MAELIWQVIFRRDHASVWTAIVFVLSAPLMFVVSIAEALAYFLMRPITLWDDIEKRWTLRSIMKDKR